MWKSIILVVKTILLAWPWICLTIIGYILEKQKNLSKLCLWKFTKLWSNKQKESVNSILRYDNRYGI